MIRWSIHTFWYKGLAEIKRKNKLKTMTLSVKASSPGSNAEFPGKKCIWYLDVNFEWIWYKMIYFWYSIEDSIYIYIYKRAYLLNRVINRALYRVIMLPPYSPGVPLGVYIVPYCYSAFLCKWEPRFREMWWTLASRAPPSVAPCDTGLRTLKKR